jgi:Uma2 family endonuclease
MMNGPERYSNKLETMSTTFSSPATTVASVDAILPPYPVRKFSVEEYFKLVDVGLLDEDDNCELLEGWIVPKMGKKPLHDGTIDLVLDVLSELLPSGWYLRVQNVLQTATSAPEPDFVVTRGKPGNFTDRHPQGDDAGLVIEVADSSLQIDRRKAQIYAPAGVPQYWIINLPECCVEVYEKPQPMNEGIRYAAPRIFRGGDELELLLDGQQVARINCALLLPAK